MKYDRFVKKKEAATDRFKTKSPLDVTSLISKADVDIIVQ